MITPAGHHSEGHPFEPAGERIADCAKGFITREPDGLFYVWWNETDRPPVWRHAYKTRAKALARAPGRVSVLYTEGVPNYRHLISFRMANGRRVRWVRWSPGQPWIREELTRELVNRGITPEQLKPNSCVITVGP